MAVAAMAAVIIMTVTVAGVAVAGVAVVMAPGKGSEKNPEKSSPRRKEGLLLGLLMQKGAQMGVISAPIDTLPA